MKSKTEIYVINLVALLAVAWKVNLELACKMSQQVKVFTTKLDNMNSTPRAQMVEGDNNRLLEVIFQPPYAPFGATHAHTDTHVYTQSK